MEYECSNIDYFPNEEYSPDPNDSTMAIPCECRANTITFSNYYSIVRELLLIKVHIIIHYKLA